MSEQDLARLKETHECSLVMEQRFIALTRTVDDVYSNKDQTIVFQGNQTRVIFITDGYERVDIHGLDMIKHGQVVVRKKIRL